MSLQKKLISLTFLISISTMISEVKGALPSGFSYLQDVDSSIKI